MSTTLILLLLARMISADYVVDPVVATINDINTVSKFVNDALSLVKGEASLDLEADTNSSYAVIAKKLRELSAQLEEMEANNEEKMNHMLTTIMNRLSETDRDKIGLTALHNYTFCIDCTYEKYKTFLKEPECFQNDSVKYFIDLILLDKSNDEMDTLDDECRLCARHLRDLSAVDRTNLQERLHEVNKNRPFEELCGISSSPQQRLFEIYRTVFISEAREFVMNIFSYAVLMVQQKESFSEKMENLAKELVARTKEYLIKTREAMEGSSLDVDLCDPKIFERGKNFVELEGAIQMFIANEINLNSNESPDECAKSCSDYSYPVSFVARPSLRKKINWNPVKSCYGHISHCISAGYTEICEMPYDSLERYTWVKDGNNNTYGNANSCAGRIKFPESFELNNQTCDICICTCEEDAKLSPAIRTVSLRPVVSDIESNRVVTGVRIILLDNMIRIQIEEGVLLPGACILQRSERWVESERFYDVEDEATDIAMNGQFYQQNDVDGEVALKRDVDFAVITQEPRILFTDELVAPLGYVITGVKLQRHSNPDDKFAGSPLQLVVRVTKFDFNVGTLSLEEDDSEWVWNDNLQGDAVDLSNAGRPTKLHGHTQISKPGEYVRFTASGPVKDAGQSTIPFFDAQSVTTSISIPLGGLGLLHRGAPGSGGFLAFRLLTLNLSTYINTELLP